MFRSFDFNSPLVAAVLGAVAGGTLTTLAYAYVKPQQPMQGLPGLPHGPVLCLSGPAGVEYVNPVGPAYALFPEGVEAVDWRTPDVSAVFWARGAEGVLGVVSRHGSYARTVSIWETDAAGRRVGHGDTFDVVGRLAAAGLPIESPYSSLDELRGVKRVGVTRVGGEVVLMFLLMPGASGSISGGATSQLIFTDRHGKVRAQVFNQGHVRFAAANGTLVWSACLNGTPGRPMMIGAIDLAAFLKESDDGIKTWVVPANPSEALRVDAAYQTGNAGRYRELSPRCVQVWRGGLLIPHPSLCLEEIAVASTPRGDRFLVPLPLSVKGAATPLNFGFMFDPVKGTFELLPVPQPRSDLERDALNAIGAGLPIR